MPSAGAAGSTCCTLPMRSAIPRPCPPSRASSGSSTACCGAALAVSATSSAGADWTARRSCSGISRGQVTRSGRRSPAPARDSPTSGRKSGPRSCNEPRASTCPKPLDGELRSSYGYTWTLQGVHGTRAPLKRRHGQVELWLERIAEPLVALARYGGPATHAARDRRAVLESAWRTLVRAQFPETIAGTTSDVVTAAADQRLSEVAAHAAELRREAVHDLVGHDADLARERADGTEPALVLWNPAARPRGGVTIAAVPGVRRAV